MTVVHFLVSTVILGFLSIFKKSQASSPYEAFNSVCLSRGHRDVRPPVQMTLAPTALSRVSTGDSDMPFSCEMKDEPAFKPLKGNPTLFLVRASRYPLNLRQQNQGPLTYLLLRKASLEVLVESCLTCSIESWVISFLLEMIRVE